MIPADVASRLRLTLPDQLGAPQAASPAGQLNDVLSDLVPGQRLTAEIQQMLPNGAYRALVNQRDITLALPFSAKSGDTLELEVVDQDGRLTLAVVTGRKDASSSTPTAAAETRLSQAGRMISDLLAEATPGKEQKATPLNGNQPLTSSMPTKAADLVPLLQQALSRSGMFYESHQAQWLFGQRPTEQLLSEPQGQLSPRLQQHAETPAGHSAAALAQTAQPDDRKEISRPGGDTPRSDLQTPSAERNSTPQPVAPDALPLVRQQLEALASQTFVWQGQIWPGQQMDWEIREEERQQSQGGEEEPSRWQTRLRLNLPHLGQVEAVLQLQGRQGLGVVLQANDQQGAQTLQAGGSQLQQRLAEAGLTLNSFQVIPHAQT